MNYYYYKKLTFVFTIKITERFSQILKTIKVFFTHVEKNLKTKDKLKMYCKCKENRFDKLNNKLY